MTRSILLLIVCLSFTACNRENSSNPTSFPESITSALIPQIVFVAPDDFRGAFKVIEHPEGIDVSKRGRTEIPVSSDGLIKVKSFKVFEKAHALKARWVSGKDIPVDPDLPPSDDEKIALWPLATVKGTRYPQETMLYLICTKK